MILVHILYFMSEILWLCNVVMSSLLCVFVPLCRQYEEVADKDDLMGVEDTAKKDILSHFTLKLT